MGRDRIARPENTKWLALVKCKKMNAEQKRQEYWRQPSSVRKETHEMKVFTAFSQAANFDLGSSANCKPPYADVRCFIGGKPYFFELGEITDERLAQDVSESLKSGIDGPGGCFSEEGPLLRLLLNKARVTYQTDGAPLDLVLHYFKQFPIDPAGVMRSKQSAVAAALLPYGPFSRIWVYDGWSKSILWTSS